MIPEELDQRVLEEALYIAENGATVRGAAKVFHVSKSTVHKDMVQRLRYLNGPLWREVREVLDKNRAERHIRGGMATCRKYRGERCGEKPGLT